MWCSYLQVIRMCLSLVWLESEWSEIFYNHKEQIKPYFIESCRTVWSLRNLQQLFFNISTCRLSACACTTPCCSWPPSSLCPRSPRSTRARSSSWCQKMLRDSLSSGRWVYHNLDMCFINTLALSEEVSYLVTFDFEIKWWHKNYHPHKSEFYVQGVPKKTHDLVFWQ